jgi:hypothetical protein
MCFCWRVAPCHGSEKENGTCVEKSSGTWLPNGQQFCNLGAIVALLGCQGGGHFREGYFGFSIGESIASVYYDLKCYFQGGSLLTKHGRFLKSSGPQILYTIFFDSQNSSIDSFIL